MMRGFRAGPWVGLCLLLSLLSVPTLAQHQGHGNLEDKDSTVVVPDGSLDVFVFAANKATGQKINASQTGSNFDHLDILQLKFGDETDDGFRISLGMKSVTPPASGPTGSNVWRSVSFSYGKVDWSIRPGGCTRETWQMTNVGCLQFRDPGRQFRAVTTVPMEINTSDKVISFSVAKKDLFNENRVPARFGASLANLTASASQYFVSFGGWLNWLPTGEPTGGVYAQDRAPDTGFGLPFTLAKGSKSRGHIALTAVDPIRVSNGEAMTIVYKVDLFNHHTEPFRVELNAKNVPFPDWTVRVPAVLKVPAQSWVSFPVILALPFHHEHGKTFTFQVEGRALEDAGSHGVVDLGVFWTDVAQPSKHHNGYLFFHSAPDNPDNLFEQTFPQVTGWVNAEPTDPDPSTTDVNIPGSPDGSSFCFFQPTTCPVPPVYRANWFLPLSPKLLLGLDFDVSKPVKAKFAIVPKLSSSDARLTVQLRYCDPLLLQSQPQGGQGQGGSSAACGNSSASYPTILAGTTVTGTLSQNVAFQVERDLPVEAAADYIPFRHGANIGILISLVTETPQSSIGDLRPVLVTKTSEAPFVLPLNEYHDPIDAAFENIGSLRLEAVTPFEKQVNPGRTTVFRFDLTSHAKVAQDVRVEVQGVNGEWAELMGSPGFTLGPGERRNLTVAVRVPEEAAHLERAELFLTAQNVDDDSVVTVTRLRAEVVKEPDIPDESSELSSFQKKQDTPGPGIWAALAAAGAASALLGARRRR